MSTYGRNRQSVADIEQQLYDLFDGHSNSRPNEAGDPAIPADALVDVFRSFSDIYGVELLTDAEMDMLKNLLASNPGLEVTPQILLAFIAEKTKHSPHDSPQGSPQENDTILPDRGRMLEREDDNQYSRSSSRDSNDTSVYGETPSRPPSVPPKTPTSRSGPSVFDTSRRQRSTPLNNNAPSSWAKRPAPAHRRKSIDESSRALSDTESSYSSSPSAFGRTPARIRAPSNPTSPSTSVSGTFSPTFGSPPLGRPISRPHSRAQSQPYNSFAMGFSSPEQDMSSGEMSPLHDREFANSSFEFGQREDSFMDLSVSSLPMPQASDSDSEGEEDASIGLVFDRSAASSTVSLEPQERLEALQRSNVDLGRKLVEAERTLQNKLQDHDSELEEMQGRLEELKSELTATKREEKELRSKERSNSTQIAALESEIAKLQKSLDNARSAYQSLQKQYQEQCAESERYRNALRRRDQEIKDHQDAAALQVVEAQKYAKEHDNYEERIAIFEKELEIAQQAHAQLDEQKQENLMLKETIDRMRYDMDEMRSNAANAAQSGSSSRSSAANSISKSLGAELLKMGGARWGLEGEDDDDDTEEGNSEELEAEEDTEGEEEEDVIQTIITRKKRKVTGRANKVETVTFSETKEYADAYTQYYTTEHTAVQEIQTDPEPSVPSTSSYAQTHDPPPTITLSTQTDPEPMPIPKVTASMEIQTDEIDQEMSRSPSPHVTVEDDEALASSSSTVLPPTPKAQTLDHLHLHPHPQDLPPSYNQVAEQDEDERVTAAIIKEWHNGIKLPMEPVANGISEDALEGWETVKEELGIDCKAIDELIATSEKTGQPRLSKDGKPLSRKNRFYNIYNTYVYGDGNGGSSSFRTGSAKQVILCMGATACVLFFMAPNNPAQYTFPGGPTYHDRATWTAFNRMQAHGEGFGFDGSGTSAFWSIINRLLGGGAARIARSWPT